MKASFENWYSKTGGHNFLQNTQGILSNLKICENMKVFDKHLSVQS